MTARWWAAAAGGAVCAVVGAWLILTAPRSAAFGWVGYSPLADTTYSPTPPDGAVLLGLALALIGAGVLGAAVTVLVLQARSRRSSSLGLSQRR